MDSNPNFFDDKSKAKLWIMNYLLLRLKPSKVKESNKCLLELICLDTNCIFHFKARLCKGKFVVKKLIDHDCDLVKSKPESALALELVKPICIDFDKIKPKEFSRHLTSNFGLQSTYMQAYRGLKANREANSALEFESYCKVKSWLEWMTRNNEGSVYDYTEKQLVGEAFPRVEYSFFMPGSSVNIFKHSLPIITLDACHTKGEFKGVIFIATAITGDNKGVILAYAIGPSECYEFWKLFVQKLKAGLNLGVVEKLVIISDREKGLIQSVREEIPNANHSYCVFPIEKYQIKVLN